MANESLRVVAAMARKGGSGKSMLVKALASAAAASDRRTLLIDTDPQEDLANWFRRSKGRDMVPATASLAVARNVEELQEAIDGAYEGDTADFVFIDTAGAAGPWGDSIAMLSDVVVTPVIATRSDLVVGRQTVEWFQGLRARVPDPSQLPPHRVLMTCFPARPSRLEGALLKTALDEFPLLDQLMQRRNAYLAMDENGFLGNVLEGVRASAKPLERSRAGIYRDALVEASDLLNSILGEA